MTWSDYGDTKGFHIYDTSTRELEFIENPFKTFVKVWYDDEGKTMETLVSEAGASDVSKKHAKVIVTSKTNPSSFDAFMTTLNDLSPISLQVV